MSNEVYAFALKNTLNEIKAACPDVSNTFIFKDSKIVAKDEGTDKETATRALGAFNAMTERAEAVGGLESVAFYGANGRVNVICVNDFYLATVASKKSDEKYVNTLTRVLVPAVLRVIEKIHPAAAEDDESAEEKPADITEEAEPEAVEEPIEEIKPEPVEEEPEPEPELFSPEPPVTQFMIDNIGGLLVPADTVRIDNAVILQWKDLYGDKEITEVDVETLNGQTTRCKFKPIKESKLEGKGIIQMPEKIKRSLQASKGELVMVKPVVE
jgi:hypothetical protein